MVLPLSALDLVPLGSGYSSHAAVHASVALARALDNWGYQRVWYAEHHNMPGIATTTPALLIAHVAPRTQRIRLGAGGVMLPNHAPLQVAEAYRLLEALHPGRIDLGIGRAPGTDPVTASALRRGRYGGSDEFPGLLAELRGFGTQSLPAGHPFSQIVAMPDDVTLPPIWLLGSSDYSARLAAQLGLGFAFAGHFSPEPPEWPLQLYRESFQPGPFREPHAIVALSVFCGETEVAAKRLASSMLVAFAQLRAGRPSRLMSPEQAEQYRFSPEEEAAIGFARRLQIVGTPAYVRERIEAVAQSTAADEVMVATHAYVPEQRLRSYELLAREFELGRG
ncbi:MAG TPA: LLM class flavin-dependent oxidoreductase [Polyangiaceae bacterium]|nr:LLM class flavin-dependent oxidoreductase [Polyangiaceae bacterium]